MSRSSGGLACYGFPAMTVRKYSLLLLCCAACHAGPEPVTPASTPAPLAPPASPPAPSASAGIAPPTTPPAIAVPGSSKAVLQLRGKGVQIYACRAKPSDGEVFEWALVGPEAELFDTQGKAVLKHSAGPTWESSDGSRVVGKVEAKADAPDGNAIPWLLLSAKTSGSAGMLSHVNFIQRVDTQAGKAAAAGCDALHADAEQRVAYAATYYFYEPVAQ